MAGPTPCCGTARDPSYLIGGELRRRAATRPGGRGSGSSSRPTSPTARSALTASSPCDEHRARSPRDLRLQGRGRGRVRRVPRGRDARSSGTAPRGGFLERGTARGVFRAETSPRAPGGSDSTWRGQRVALRPGRPQRRQRRRGARRACVRGAPADAVGRARGLPRRRAPVPRRSAHPGRAVSTTTPTARPRSRATSPPRARRCPAARGRLPADLLAHGAARARVRRGAGAADVAVRPRGLLRARAGRGLPRRERPGDRRGRGRRGAAAGPLAARVRRRAAASSPGCCATATCASSSAPANVVELGRSLVTASARRRRSPARSATRGRERAPEPPTAESAAPPSVIAAVAAATANGPPAVPGPTDPPDPRNCTRVGRCEARAPAS